MKDEDTSSSSEAPAPKKKRAPAAATASEERAITKDNAALFALGADGSDAREFLLAERPTFVRGTLWLSLALLFAIIAWACIGQIDIVISAPGVVRPRGDL